MTSATRNVNESVTVFCFDDYYIGEYWRDADPGKASAFDRDYIFEIPRGQYDRWKDTELAFRRMQEEIRELLANRRQRAIGPKHFPGLPH